MKVKIDKDEWWPVYSAATDNWGVEAEIADEDWAEYQQVMEQFSSWQDYLRKLYKEKGGKL